jgi:ring-1,2-phenylacetyl-CoA epoxidase subunit PaaE
VAVRPAEGRFTVDAFGPAPAHPRHFGAVAAGSGITPVLALIQDQLAAAASDTFTLVYTNRTTAETMFVDELAALKDRYPARFTVYHVLTRERRGSNLLSGRLDPDRLGRLFGSVMAPAHLDGVFLCGPSPLVGMCRRFLTAAGMPAKAVRSELFSTGGATGPVPRLPERVSDGETTLQFRLDGTTATITSPAGSQERLLNAALRARADVPHSCSGGVCGTCRAKVTHGQVHMVENYALDDDEIAAGLVLTCQAVAVSDEVGLDYDTI